MSEKPKQIGNYRVIQELGRSPIAIVYQVCDDFGKTYTLKVLRTFAVNDRNIERLKREERLMKRFQRNKVVLVHRYELIDSEHCLLMEYVKGEDLGEKLKREKQLPIKDATEILW